jgi:multisubunit Na+/H+ antiporter MnhF subunit
MKATAPKQPDRILITDGLRTILAVPLECQGCHVMHYYFILTAAGHRCLECAENLR